MHSVDIIEPTTDSQQVKGLLRRAITSAKRRGSWFSLNGVERGILSLATRLEVKFSSVDLLRAISSVLRKLEEYGDSAYGMLRAGARLALAFSERAVAWGNASAHGWRHDRNYVEYLARNMAGARKGQFRP